MGATTTPRISPQPRSCCLALKRMGISSPLPGGASRPRARQGRVIRRLYLEPPATHLLSHSAPYSRRADSSLNSESCSRSLKNSSYRSEEHTSELQSLRH